MVTTACARALPATERRKITTDAKKKIARFVLCHISDSSFMDNSEDRLPPAPRKIWLSAPHSAARLLWRPTVRCRHEPASFGLERESSPHADFAAWERL